MIKVRLTVSAVLELDPQHFPFELGVTTPEKILDFAKEMIEEDPVEFAHLLFDQKYSIEGELL